jgi:hypothetical protein
VSKHRSSHSLLSVPVWHANSRYDFRRTDHIRSRIFARMSNNSLFTALWPSSRVEKSRELFPPAGGTGVDKGGTIDGESEGTEEILDSISKRR